LTFYTAYAIINNMPKEKSTTSPNPNAIAFQYDGKTRYMGDSIRKLHEIDYKELARRHNEARPLHQRALGLGRVTMENMMREDSDRMNAHFDSMPPKNDASG
jgi:hypothetical protein